MFWACLCMLTTINYASIIFVQIGNCVGAANHQHFIVFLISAVISTIYVSIMSAYAAWCIWPPLTNISLGHLSGVGSYLAWRMLKEIIFTLLSSAAFLSVRGLVLVYLIVSSVALEIGLIVLLWQQLCYIYEGKTYLSHLSSQEGDEVGEKDCKNLFRFFGCPYTMSRYLPNIRNSRKKHEKWNGYVNGKKGCHICFFLIPSLLIPWLLWYHDIHGHCCSCNAEYIYYRM